MNSSVICLQRYEHIYLYFLLTARLSEELEKE